MILPHELPDTNAFDSNLMSLVSDLFRFGKLQNFQVYKLYKKIIIMILELLNKFNS